MMAEEMDRLLSNLPEHRPPAGMIRRVVLEIQRRQRRRQRLYSSLSAGFVLVGSVLFLPWVMRLLAQVQLPQSGLPLLASTMDVVYNAGPKVMATWDGINALQASLSRSMGVLETTGLVLLIAGALLGISVILANLTSEPRLRSS